jgi:hypothetical protein
MDKKHGKSMIKIINKKMKINRITTIKKIGIRMEIIEGEEIIEEGVEEAMVEEEEVISKIITTKKNKRNHNLK